MERWRRTEQRRKEKVEEWWKRKRWRRLGQWSRTRIEMETWTWQWQSSLKYLDFAKKICSLYIKISLLN
jgi:hypothetical protein